MPTLPTLKVVLGVGMAPSSYSHEGEHLETVLPFLFTPTYSRLPAQKRLAVYPASSSGIPPIPTVPAVLVLYHQDLPVVEFLQLGKAIKGGPRAMAEISFAPNVA